MRASESRSLGNRQQREVGVTPLYMLFGQRAGMRGMSWRDLSPSSAILTEFMRSFPSDSKEMAEADELTRIVLGNSPLVSTIDKRQLPVGCQQHIVACEGG